jgi:hypothetical protein
MTTKSIGILAVPSYMNIQRCTHFSANDQHLVDQHTAQLEYSNELHDALGEECEDVTMSQVLPRQLISLQRILKLLEERT